ncbi:MAG: hypothetical protein JRF49_06625 [Deltaproteobacteria bacterium]|nr:hypothetical protein [Deltaproteobacteria bacterium]
MKRKKLNLTLLSCVMVLAMVMLTGCDVPPLPNAGPDQTVNADDTVTLDGSSSFDPDPQDPNPGPLTYSWTQTAGTSVALSDADTANPTFTAPNVDETLTFQMTVTDDEGNSDTDSVDINVSTVPVTTTTTIPPSVLFIANITGLNVTSYDNPETVNGNIAPDTNLAGASTQLGAPSDIVVTDNETLAVSNFATNAITSYSDARNTNGNLTPDGNVQGAATLIAGPTSLAINTSEDLLFVANNATNVINVYSDPSTAGFNGNLPPTRAIASAALINPLGINFGASDDLYVANNGGGNIIVFASASLINGTVAPDRIINSASFVGANLWDVFVDGNDNLFVVDSNGFIYMFNNAFALNGTVAPDFTLTVNPAVFLTAIAVDSNDTGYIVDNGANAVYSYDDISTLNGALNPDRTIAGASTQLLGPLRVFLVE